MRDGINDLLTLIIIIDKGSLVGRANVELATVTDYAIVSIVVVAFNKVEDGDFAQFNFHACGLLLRMKIRL